MSKKYKISDLCSQLDPQLYESVEIDNMTKLEPSEQKIEELVFQKLHAEQLHSKQKSAISVGKRGHMKKKTGKILLIAAMLCLFATTAFAMAGGFEYFRSIFGDTVENAQQDIQSIGITASDDGYQMTLESMLTDGYKTNLIVSLTTLSGGAKKKVEKTDPIGLFETVLRSPSGEESQGMASYTCNELTEFSSKEKRFYHIQIDSLENCAGGELVLSLSQELSSLTLSAKVEGTAAARELSINQAIDDNLTVETIQLSSLGILVIGNEKHPGGGLPTPQIDLIFQDGSREELISPMSFDAGDGETIIGGGSVVIGDNPTAGPLVIGTHGQRNPDGKVVTAGEFGRIIRMDEVKAISVNGVDYEL